jgi:hypothetical protein
MHLFRVVAIEFVDQEADDHTLLSPGGEPFNAFKSRAYY